MLTVMLQCETPETAIGRIRNANFLGADAYGLQVESLKPEYQNTEIYKRIFAEGKGGTEAGQRHLVLLTVGQLLLDLLHRRMAALLKPGRKLFDAFLADLAVLQLFVAEHSDFLAADFTILFLKSIKQAHTDNLLVFICLFVR